MEFIKQALSASLQRGFINHLNHSTDEYLPELIVNDKEAGKKVLTTINRSLTACDEFWFSVAFVTTSGVATIINTLHELEKKDVKGKLLVSQYLNFSQPEALKRLLNFTNIELKIATKGNFHSKGYLFKKGNINDLIIGSSNLTANALCENTEWNLKISATAESYIINNVIKEFKLEFEKAQPVSQEYIANYETIYIQQLNSNKKQKEELIKLDIIYPNDMQIDALNNLKHIRSLKKTKALLISATGTGKTYLSAFDAKEVNPKKLLFVVHRLNIANAAMKSFEAIFGNSKTLGVFSGDNREVDKDFIFSTIQTISKEEHLQKFEPDFFDYIVIDETHRAGAESYQKILQYFEPKFLLGMTATPERTDGLDIFKLFDHTIAYEIRLHKAMEEHMLSPFHYYGVTDITVDGTLLEENADFLKLTSNERVDKITKTAKFYGCDNGVLRGLVFCSSIEECKTLSNKFNAKGYKTIALTGENSESDRSLAITNLESNNVDEKLDYIFTVDIFNEGIDIPKVNQVIMLRPTQSAIIFVQQLGRGLRKVDGKEYLTVIDFIGNYSNSYLIPIALYGDTTYNRDTLRKLMASGSSIIPGSSTINFDEISKKRIFEAIDNANLRRRKDLINDYKLLKFKIGKVPMMLDFVQHGSRDPQLFVEDSKSYFNFVADIEDYYKNTLNKNEIKVLELFSIEINNGKRVEESVLLLELLENKSTTYSKFTNIIFEKYGYVLNKETIDSTVSNICFEFITEKSKKNLVPVNKIYSLNILMVEKEKIAFHPNFVAILKNKHFLDFFKDSIAYSILVFSKQFKLDMYNKGFIYYRKYSRKDVFRILNWKQNPVAQNVGGYIISPDKANCPIFVNYHKAENISNSTKYEDGFINNIEFEWMSKSKRTLESPDVKTIRNYKSGLRLPLFIKKSNDEGKEFYYMGDLTPKEDSLKQTTMVDDKKKSVSVVKFVFELDRPVEDSLYNYITLT